MHAAAQTKLSHAVAVLSLGRGFKGPQFCCNLQFRGYPCIFAKIAQISDFLAFPNFRKVGKFAASIERPKTKSASASGRLRPSDPLTKGSAPGPR